MALSDVIKLYMPDGTVMMKDIENSDFAVRGRKEIISILDGMRRDRMILSIDTQDGTSIISTVLEVDAENELVYLDASADDNINNLISNCPFALLHTEGGVEISWHGAHLKTVTLTDGIAFFMPIPRVIERIQRREYFRLSTPKGSDALLCKIYSFNAVISDMSVGGVGLSIEGVPPANIYEGAVLEKCSVNFPSFGFLPLTLKVFSLRPSSKTESGEQMYHIGLAFVNLSGPASYVVQRFLSDLEIARLNRA